MDTTGNDEFVTAMIEAEKYNIPVRLGDAPQNDTLKSIKGIVSPEIFNPKRVAEGTLFLVRYHSKQRLCAGVRHRQSDTVVGVDCCE